MANTVRATKKMQHWRQRFDGAAEKGSAEGGGPVGGFALLP